MVADSRVNTYTDSAQFAPSINSLEDGGWLIAWQSLVQDGSGFGVYQQRYDKRGNAVGDETLVNTSVTNSQQSPSVASLKDGGWVVTWYGRGGASEGNNVYQQRYDKDGEEVGGEVLVGTLSSNALFSVITGLESGGWVVSWYHGSFGNYQVSQQLFNAAGNTVGSVSVVNTFTIGDQWIPNIGALAGGGWVVTWDSLAQDNSESGVYQQRFNSSGTAVGSEARISTTTDGNQKGSTPVTLADGGWVVTWESEALDGSGFGIAQQRFAASGARVGNEVRVNTTTEGEQIHATGAGLSDGGWIVVWQSTQPSGSGADIYQQRYDAAGEAVGGEEIVNTYDPLDQFVPTVTALSDGGWVVSWTDGSIMSLVTGDSSLSGQDGSSVGVFQKRYNAEGEEMELGAASVAPIGHSFEIDMLEDESFVFSVDLFGYSDPGDVVLDSITIVSPPTAANLTLDGATLEANAAIDADDIAALVFSPKANAFGTFRFKFAVTNADGVTSDESYTATVNVEDVLDTFNGKKGKDKLVGTAGEDRLDGKAGNDTLTGKNGADIFVFEKNYDRDIITDFHAKGADHDVLDIRGLTSVKSFKDLVNNHMEAVKGGVLIDGLKGDEIMLGAVKLKDLDAGDFLI